MDNGYTLSVKQLNEYVNGLLRRDMLLRGLTVRGEISGFKHHSSGHLYFSLKEDGALIRCVMFRQDAARLSITPRDGMAVLAAGEVSLFVRDGQYQLYVSDMTEEGDGLLYRRFMLLKTRLEARGLFDEAHKKPLPLLPRRLGVITSPTGAALQDIINVTRRRFPKMDILFCPVKVQGEGAAAEIASAIADMDASGMADVIIVGRGGGSIEELWEFNEETVAQAIYAAKTPIVSAVGHETDYSIADFTADLRAPTPSAAAELCVPEYERLRYEVESKRTALCADMRAMLLSKRLKLEAIRDSAAFASAGHALEIKRKALVGATLALRNAARADMAARYGALDRLTAALEGLAPGLVLKRGYAIVKKQNGEYASSVFELAQGMEAELIMSGGAAKITVNCITEENHDS